MRLKQLFIFLIAFTLSTVVFAKESTMADNSQFSPNQTKQIQKIVHQYLLNNPQIIVEAVRELQAKQEAAMMENAKQAIKENAKALLQHPESPVIGNPKGAVTLVEFLDYQCPHCKDVRQMVNNLVAKNKNLRVVIKEFPIFPGSEFAAKAAIAAGKQGKFLAFHEALLQTEDPVTKEKVLKAALLVGLDVDELQKDMNDKSIANELATNLELAKKIGLVGTPSFVIASTNPSAKEFKSFFIPGVASQAYMQSLINKATQ